VSRGWGGLGGSALVVLAVLSSLAVLQDARASSAWGSEELISKEPGNWAYAYEHSLDVAADSFGNAIAVWTQLNGMEFSVWANRYVAGIGWGTAELLEGEPGNASDANIAVDPAGNAIAVWAQYSDIASDIMAIPYVAGVGWETPARIGAPQAPPAYVQGPHVAMDPGGSAIAVWDQWNVTRSVQANRYVAGIGWGTVELLQNRSDYGNPPVVATDSAGNAIAVWHRSDPTYWWKYLWASRYVAGVGWEPPELIDTVRGNGVSGFLPDIAFDPAGNAIVVHDNSGGRTVVRAQRYIAGIGWETPELIDMGSSARGPRLAVDSSGNAITAWTQWTPTSCCNIWASRYVAGIGWGRPEPLEAEPGDAYLVSVAGNPSGNVIAVWSQSDGVYYNTVASRYVPGTGWGAPELIETTSGDVFSTAVAMDPGGNASAVWMQLNWGEISVWANRYATPPPPDMTPPNVAFLSHADGQWVSTAIPLLVGTAADTGGSGLDRVEVSCDQGSTWGLAVGTVRWYYEGCTLLRTRNMIHARSFDAAGWESSHAVITLNYDPDPPTVAFSSPADGFTTFTSPITVDGVADDGAGSGVVRVEVSCDGGATWSPATGTTSWSRECPLVIGANALRVRAFDFLGWESVHRLITVTYEPNDVSVPLLLSPLHGSWTPAATAMFAWSFQDPNVGDVQTGFRVDIDADAAFGSIDYSSGDMVSPTPSWSFVPLADGCWYWRVRTQDSAGAWSPFSAPWQMCVDTLGPATSLSVTGATYASGGMTYLTSSALVSLAATDGGSGLDSIQYRVWDGLVWSPWAPYVAPIPLPAPDGVRHIVYYATDALGNPEAMNQATFVVDDSPPTTTLSVGTPQVPIGGALYVSAATTLSLAAVDGGSPPVGLGSTEYQVDGAVWTPYIGPFGLPREGAYLVAYRSRDLLGNVENSNAFAVIVDGTAPTATLEIGDPRYAAANVYVTSRTPITLAATDEGALPVGVALVEYRLNGGAWTPYAGAISLSGPDRTSVLEYRASDLLGNVATGSVDVVVDDTPPATEVRPASGPYTTRSSFVVSASDAGSGVARTEYRIDGGAWTSYGEPFSLPAGEHAIGYRSVDHVGNVEVELTFFVTIGTPLPSIVVDVWWLIILVILSGLSLLALNESRRLAFITPIVILWARLRHNTILEHYTRGNIHGYLLANPGVHFEAIRRDMDLGVGTLAYHVWVLEREGMIRSWRDGRFRRYALSSQRIADAQPELTDIERILLKNIHGRPGRTQRELAEEVGLSQPTISYHISKMAELGVVRVDREGLRKRYTADIRGIAHHLESLERAGARQDVSKNGTRNRTPR